MFKQIKMISSQQSILVFYLAWVVFIAVVLIGASVGMSITRCCPQFGIAVTRCLNWVQRLSTSLSTTTDTPQQEEPSLCDLEFLIIPEVV